MHCKKNFTIETKPTQRFISLDEAKNHLKIDVDCNTDDDLILSLIETAHEVAEKYCDIYIGSQTVAMLMDRLGASIYGLYYLLEVPKYPINSITKVEYKDENGEYQTLESTKYEVDIVSNPARIYFYETPVYSYNYLNNLKITFNAGYTELPYAIKAAMMMIIGHLYENRQDVVTGTIATEIPNGSKYLMDNFKNYAAL